PGTTIIGTPPILTTLPLPCGSPKLAPVITNPIFFGPVVNDKPVMIGVTVKILGLLETVLDGLFTVTTTAASPAGRPLGACTTILSSCQLLGVATVSLNFTVLDPWMAPKFRPLIVNGVSTGPEVGDTPKMIGGPGAVTVKLAPLVAWPLAVVTTMFP